MSLSIAVLITNFNTWSLTQKCITELTHWPSNILSEILVIDDASDETVPMFFPEKVRVLQNHQNKGYVASVNIGFSELNEDIVILFDSDAYPLMDMALSIQSLFVNNPNLGAIGFQLVDEQKHPTGSHEKLPTALEFLLGQSLAARLSPWLSIKHSKEICLYSCAIAVRKKAFEQIGGFDEDFDFLDADIDFSIRLQKAGWDVRVCPELSAFHTGGGSPQTTAKRVLRYHKNRWKLLQKHDLLPFPALFKLLLVIRHNSEYLLLKVLGGILIPDPSKLQDKLYSRRKLIKSVWSDYGNEF